MKLKNGVYEQGAISKLLAKKKLKREDDVIEPDKNALVYGSRTLFDKHATALRRKHLPSPCENIEATNEEGPSKRVHLSIDEEGVSKSVRNSRDAQRANRSKKTQSVNEKNDCTIFVGNAPLTMSRKDIRKLFLKFGPIESVRLRGLIPKSKTITKKIAAVSSEVSGRMNSLNFYVKFKKPHSAQKAVKLNGEVIEGHNLRVDSCSSNRQYERRTTVFVGNLPFDAKENELINHFKRIGDVSFVRIVRDRNSGYGKGFAFVSFKDSFNILPALQLNDTLYDGRRIRVTRIKKKSQLRSDDSPREGKRSVSIKRYDAVRAGGKMRKEFKRNSSHKFKRDRDQRNMKSVTKSIMS